MSRIVEKDGRYMVLVKNCDGIEFPIINTHRKEEAELMKKYYDEGCRS